MSTIAKFSLAEYDDLIARGAFNSSRPRRLELIHGELRDMSPRGPIHEEEVDLLTEWTFQNVPLQEVRVRVQNSVGVPELDSAPEPDLAWVKRKSYRDARPTASGVLLLIEVSDSSLSYDRGEKAELFAAAGVEDYWIVNVPGRSLEVRRKPRDGSYMELTTHNPGEEVSPLAFPDLALPVSLLFPDEEGET